MLIQSESITRHVVREFARYSLQRSIENSLAKYSANWDESKHPRSNDGKFQSEDGTQNKSEPKEPEGKPESREQRKSQRITKKLTSILERHGLDHKIEVAYDPDEEDHMASIDGAQFHPDELEIASDEVEEANKILKERGISLKSKLEFEPGEYFGQFSATITPSNAKNYEEWRLRMLTEEEEPEERDEDDPNHIEVSNEIDRANKRLEEYGLHPGVKMENSGWMATSSHDLDALHAALDALDDFRKKPEGRQRYSGRWITLKPHGKEDEGYVHVQIDEGGTITSGPNKLKGKHLGHATKTHDIVEPKPNNLSTTVDKSDQQADTTPEAETSPKQGKIMNQSVRKLVSINSAEKIAEDAGVSGRKMELFMDRMNQIAFDNGAKTGDDESIPEDVMHDKIKFALAGSKPIKRPTDGLQLMDTRGDGHDMSNVNGR